jgi:hypothetical protein
VPPSRLSNLLQKRGNQEVIQADEDGGITHNNMIIAFLGHIELILEEEEFDLKHDSLAIIGRICRVLMSIMDFLAERLVKT